MLFPTYFRVFAKMNVRDVHCLLNKAKSESVNYAAKNPGKRIAACYLLPGFIIL